MNWDRIESNWKQCKVDVKAQWGKLSDHQLNTTDGKRDLLLHEIEKTYGISEHAAEWQLSGWQVRLTAQNPEMTPESETSGIASWWQQNKLQKSQ